MDGGEEIADIISGVEVLRRRQSDSNPPERRV